METSSIKMPHFFSPEEASEAAKKNQSSFSPEERKANASRLGKLAHETGKAYEFNQADRSKGGKARVAKHSKEDLARIGAMGGKIGAIKLNAMLTFEQRSANAKKAHETRRRNKQLAEVS